MCIQMCIQKDAPLRSCQRFTDLEDRLRHLLIANILPFLSHRTPHLCESLPSLLPLHPPAPLALFLFERGKFIRRKEKEGVRGERKREGGREKFY